MDARALGRIGEEAAARHFLSIGYEILSRGWRCPAGEIDLVAMDGGEVVFVEVKTRRDVRFGGPEQAVTFRKRERIRKACLSFLVEKGWERRAFRIDVVSIIWSPVRPDRLTLRHIRSAVGEVD